MRASRVGWLLLAAVVCVAVEAAGADPPAKAAKVAAIDPVGMPPAALHKPDKAMSFLWYDEGVWHLRNQSEGLRRFDGVVRVRGGKIKSLAPAVTEPRKKQRRKRDALVPSQNGRRIDFAFVTNGGSDGFDFEIVGEKATLDFELRLDGTALPPDRVAIGREANPAPASKFSLSAQPKPPGEKAS